MNLIKLSDKDAKNLLDQNKKLNQKSFWSNKKTTKKVNVDFSVKDNKRQIKDKHFIFGTFIGSLLRLTEVLNDFECADDKLVSKYLKETTKDDLELKIILIENIIDIINKMII